MTGHDRLTDPGEHFPYKRDDATAALETPPEAGTHNHPGHWYTSAGIIDATGAYIAAQETLLRDGTPKAKTAYDRAAEDLVAARREHRASRAGTAIQAERS